MSRSLPVLGRSGWIPVIREALRRRRGLAPGTRGSMTIPKALKAHPAALAVWIVGTDLQDHRFRAGGGLLLTVSYLLLLLGRLILGFF